MRINNWIKESVTKGAKILAGGKILNEKANIYAPTVLTNTKPDMKIWSEEAFAPIVLVEKAKNFKEAIDYVNDSRYGLQAGVFSNDLTNILMAQKLIEAGGIIINESPGFRIDSMPYGGIKDSGLGREGTLYSMHDYTEPKLIILDA
jgi:glyceraldehyde-3-phosphate dehydrogenase (NADP+)